MTDARDITRREAVTRTAMFLGGTLAASHISGIRGEAWARAAAPGWRAGTLTAGQSELVATIAEHIIPTTETPGARAAGVHRFVDVILSDYYKDDERKKFLDGLAQLEARSEKELGAPFMKATAKQQLDLLTKMDAESYPPQRVLEKAEPMNAERVRMRDSLARQSSTGAAVSDPTRPSADGGGGEAARREVERGWFFRRMKELTLLGYYTSEAGAMTELKVNPMGVYRGDIPYRSIGHAWA
jgi:gluconate 2-dehydrogenase gamma chain